MLLRQSSVSAGFYKGVLEPGSIKLTTPNAVTRKQQGEVWCLRSLRSSLVQCEYFFLSWVKQHLRGTTLKDEDLTNHGNENREIGSCLPAGLQWSYLTLDSPHREDAVDLWSWKTVSTRPNCPKHKICLHIPNAFYTTNTAIKIHIFTYSLPVWRIGFGKLHHKNWHQKSAPECSGCHIIQLYPHPVAGLVSVTSNAPSAVMVDHADFSISSIYGMRRFHFNHSTLESWKDPKNQII